MARGLATTGLGDSLLHAAESLDSPGLCRYLIGWREQLRITLSTDPGRTIGQKQPQLASTVSDTFPNPAVINLYVHPTTSWTQGPLPCMSSWTKGSVDIVTLANLCERLFSWGTADGIMKNFQKHLYAGISLQFLSNVR